MVGGVFANYLSAVSVTVNDHDHTCALEIRRKLIDSIRVLREGS